MANNNIMKGNNMRTILGVLVVVAVVAGAGFFVYKDISSRDKNVTVWGDINTPVAGVSVGVGAGEGENYEIKMDTSGDKIVTQTHPLESILDRRIVFGENVSMEVRELLVQNIEKITEELRKDPESFDSWINLGIQYKIAEDYKNAKDVWEYASTVWPDHPLLFGNLGDLYGYYLHETTKAEQNFLEAIKVAPDQVEYYFKTAEFYRDVVKDPARARGIVERGIEANPTSEELKTLLASLQ